MFGADDFLPCLTWVLLRSDVVTLQIDTDYMMELLDPTQLQGEGKEALYKHTEGFKLSPNVEIKENYWVFSVSPYQQVATT